MHVNSCYPSQTNSSVQTENPNENESVQFTDFCMSIALKKEFMAVLIGSNATCGMPPLCRVEFWNLRTVKKLWSHAIEASNPNRGHIQITDNFRVVLPRNLESDILVCSQTNCNSITIPTLVEESVRVMGNHIVGCDRDTFYIMKQPISPNDTEYTSLIESSYQFPENLAPCHWTIGVSDKYYVSRLGKFHHYTKRTHFEGSSSLFIANNEKKEFSLCNINIDANTYLSALSIINDTLFIATCKPKRRKESWKFFEPRIIMFDLINKKITQTYKPDSDKGIIKFMQKEKDQFMYILKTRKKNQLIVTTGNEKSPLTKISFRKNGLFNNLSNNLSPYNLKNKTIFANGSEYIFDEGADIKVETLDYRHCHEGAYPLEVSLFEDVMKVDITSYIPEIN
ncbi:MAG: hypothetical protein VX777_04335 [Chlamydiota bacterium]|nr:hypothetical protein [Chlamydiota bacterium]